MPEGVIEYIEGINIFNSKVSPVGAVGPMICSSRIELNENERLFLEKGPRFMMRGELNEKEFRVEIEKMIAKESMSNDDIRQTIVCLTSFGTNFICFVLPVITSRIRVAILVGQQ